MEDRHLSLSEVAGLMGVSERTVRRWIHSGKLKAYKPGRDYRIPEGAVRELVEESEVYPKEARRWSLEPSFNDALGDQRREDVYGPWLEFVNRYADRWEQRIEAGDLDLGSVNEFVRVLEELGPVLQELNARELREFPVSVSDTFGGHEAITGQAIWRLSDLLNPMAQAGGAKFADSELEQLRRKRESPEQWGRVAS